MCNDLTCSRLYIINGHKVLSWYAGIDNYCVDGETVVWTIRDVARLCGVTSDIVLDEFWKQRNNSITFNPQGSVVKDRNDAFIEEPPEQEAPADE